MDEPKWVITVGRMSVGGGFVDTVAVALGGEFSEHLTPDEARQLANELLAFAAEAQPAGEVR